MVRSILMAIKHVRHPLRPCPRPCLPSGLMKVPPFDRGHSELPSHLFPKGKHQVWGELPGSFEDLARFSKDPVRYSNLPLGELMRKCMRVSDCLISVEARRGHRRALARIHVCHCLLSHQMLKYTTNSLRRIHRVVSMRPDALRGDERANRFPG